MVLSMFDETIRTFLLEAIVGALSENYESIYSVDLTTGEYDVYYESDSYRRLELSHSGSDFFATLDEEVEKVIDPEDKPYVLKMLSKETLTAGVSEGKYHELVYRVIRNGRQVYHQLRATLRRIDGRDYALMGVRDVDAVVRLNAARENALASERQKSGNYLDAILATAAAYIDANLTGDCVLSQSTGPTGKPGSRLAEVPSVEEMPCYGAFQSWVADNLISRNREKYLQVSSRKHLLECFERGTRRASVPFSIRTLDDGAVPCRAIFYLYREKATKDVHSLCVIYDLTDEQRREKELEDLKFQLDLSRIRNSTSQMKPHFLYNALGSIQEVVLEDPVRAAGLLEDFTVYLRSCVKAMDGDDPIPFMQEIENIKAYTSIEKMRLGDRLAIVYELAETDFKVLPLSIQPLVENAIRHGIYPLGKMGGTVVIRSFAIDDEWIVQVIDTGRGFNSEEHGRKLAEWGEDSTGLRNIRFRLEKILGATMEVASAEGCGTCVTVRIPRGEVAHESDDRR